MSDNAFWNSLRAKAAEILDSVGIYIENRIERDSGILAAVGIFAVYRIRRDVGRALPAAGRAARTLLLAANSTYAERLLERGAQFALPSTSSFVDAVDDDDDDRQRGQKSCICKMQEAPPCFILLLERVVFVSAA